MRRPHLFLLGALLAAGCASSGGGAAADDADLASGGSGGAASMGGGGLSAGGNPSSGGGVSAGGGTGVSRPLPVFRTSIVRAERAATRLPEPVVPPVETTSIAATPRAVEHRAASVSL